MNKIFASILLIALTSVGLASDPSPPSKAAVPISCTSLSNLFSLSPRLYSASAPETKEAYAFLDELGIKTIISVDGTSPNVAGARKFGIRYIHLPVGYNGTTTSNALRLIKAVQVSAGPVLVHCHHGQHRGPFAAALIAQALDNWTPTQALAWLTAAGTSPEYHSLFAQAANFRAPSPQELSRVSTNFPEKAGVSGLVETMIQIDTQFEHLHSIQSAGYAAPPGHPDLFPANEALLLAELYREALRSTEVHQRGADFKAQLESAESEAWELQRFFKAHPIIEGSNLTAARDLFSRVHQRCLSCHASHRN